MADRQLLYILHPFTSYVSSGLNINVFVPPQQQFLNFFAVRDRLRIKYIIPQKPHSPIGILILYNVYNNIKAVYYIQRVGIIYRAAWFEVLNFGLNPTVVTSQID